MSTRNDYTVREWNDIAAAPAAAGLALACAEAGPSGPATDAMAVGRVIVRSARGDAPEIVKGLVDNVRRCNCRAAMPDSASDGHGYRSDVLMATVARAVEAVASASPAEVEPFKAWLASIAAKLFHAAKAARASPPDAVPVTRTEQAAIDRLAGVLAVSAPAGHLAASRSRSTSMLRRPRPVARPTGEVPASRALLYDEIDLMAIRIAD